MGTARTDTYSGEDDCNDNNFSFDLIFDFTTANVSTGAQNIVVIRRVLF